MCQTCWVEERQLCQRDCDQEKGESGGLMYVRRCSFGVRQRDVEKSMKLCLLSMAMSCEVFEMKRVLTMVGLLDLQGLGGACPIPNISSSIVTSKYVKFITCISAQK